MYLPAVALRPPLLSALNLGRTSVCLETGYEATNRRSPPRSRSAAGVPVVDACASPYSGADKPTLICAFRSNTTTPSVSGLQVSGCPANRVLGPGHASGDGKVLKKNLRPCLKTPFVARPSERFLGKAAGAKRPEAYRDYVEEVFAPPTPPPELAAGRSRREF